MTDEDRIERITKLLNDLDLDEMTYDEYMGSIYDQSVKDIVDGLWRFYCFANDISDTLNM